MNEENEEGCNINNAVMNKYTLARNRNTILDEMK